MKLTQYTLTHGEQPWKKQERVTDMIYATLEDLATRLRDEEGVSLDWSGRTVEAP